MKIAPDDGGRRLLVIGAAAAALAAFFLANISAVAGAVGALLALGLLGGAIVVARRNAAKG